MAGGRLSMISDSLTELHLDNSRLLLLNSENAEAYENGGQSGFFLFKFCSSLERLSIKNVSWASEPRVRKRKDVSQAMLIKMVRNHPTLRWLRSDLTEENIAMLQQERPDITFLTE